MLIVYVDDFKLAAKTTDHDGIWKQLKAIIDMDDETIDGRFLGCEHESFTSTTTQLGAILDHLPHKVPRVAANQLCITPTTTTYEGPTTYYSRTKGRW